MRLLAPIQSLMGLYTSIASARVSLARVCEILDTVPDVTEASDAIAVPAVQGRITFDDVSFAHDRGQQTIDALSFTADAGEVVAIVGPSGSGKSTVADLLVRLVDPDTGVVRLDGHDLRTMRLDDIRRHIVVVDQTPVILHASLADNLRYGRPEATDADLARAIRAAALEGFVARQPQGLATVVGERGSALSAGERQRLAIARALVTDPAVLVLDEPTAALDPVSERDVVAGYEAAMKGRTTIIITHRPEPAQRASRVVFVAGPDGEKAEAAAFMGLFGAEPRPA
jgi:ATP-binding cassette subfamily B protein